MWILFCFNFLQNKFFSHNTQIKWTTLSNILSNDCLINHSYNTIENFSVFFSLLYCLLTNGQKELRKNDSCDKIKTKIKWVCLAYCNVMCWYFVVWSSDYFVRKTNAKRLTVKSKSILQHRNKETFFQIVMFCDESLFSVLISNNHVINISLMTLTYN